MKYFSVKGVVCSRRGTYDAEIHFTVEDGIDKRTTTAKVLQTGFTVRKEAEECAKKVEVHIEEMIGTYIGGYLSTYKDAKP